MYEQHSQSDVRYQFSVVRRGVWASVGSPWNAESLTNCKFLQEIVAIHVTICSVVRSLEYLYYSGMMVYSSN